MFKKTLANIRPLDDQVEEQEEKRRKVSYRQISKGDWPQDVNNIQPQKVDPPLQKRGSSSTYHQLMRGPSLDSTMKKFTCLDNEEQSSGTYLLSFYV